MKLIRWSIAAFGLTIALTDCNGNNQKTSTAATDTLVKHVSPDTSQVVISAIHDTIFAREKDTTIQMVNGQVFIKGYSRSNKRQPTYSIKVEKGQTITATVRPVEKNGNVRINQIQLPDKSFDGPFGDSLHYTLKKSGTIRFIIGQNLMAGDPWAGDFIFHLKFE